MQLTKHIKPLLLFLLTFLLVATPTHAKTELVLPQKQVIFSVEQSQRFYSIEKEVQPNVGFLKEKTKFVAVEGVSAVNTFVFSERVGKVLAQAGSDWFNLSSFKNISAKIPGGTNKTNLGKGLWNDAYKITPPNGSTAKNVIDDIIANGDALGTKTEGLVDDIMTAQGYKKADGKYFGTNGTNGYDGVYYKGTLDNPTEIIIIESKQMSATGSATLGSPNPSTGLPSQMSDAWIQYVAEQKLMNLGGDKTKLANTIINSPPNFVQKYVSVVDKSTGEINFLKLANY